MSRSRKTNRDHAKRQLDGDANVLLHPNIYPAVIVELGITVPKRFGINSKTMS